MGSSQRISRWLIAETPLLHCSGNIKVWGTCRLKFKAITWSKSDPFLEWQEHETPRRVVNKKSDKKQDSGLNNTEESATIFAKSPRNTTACCSRRYLWPRCKTVL